jgi:mono/diheme cytochrome c family protein
MLSPRIEYAYFQGTNSLMRSSLIFLFIAVCALIATACGGPSDGALEASRQRQAKEVAAVGGVPPEGVAQNQAAAEQTKEENKGEAPDDSGTTKGIDEAETSTNSEDEEADSTKGAINDDSRSLFSDTCASCHTLADADASGTVGPNLDDLKPTEQQVADQIQNGGGGMPPGLLTGADADAVAAYVAAAAGK